MNLKQRFGTENHFTVPENYFKELVPTIMEQLPEVEEKVTPPIRLWDKVKPWIYMAAMFCGLFFSIRTVVNRSDSLGVTNTIGSEEFSELPEEYLDPIIDNVVLDDYSLYMYLTEADESMY